jgi:uncharacterized protein
MCPAFHFTWLSSLLFVLTGALLGSLGGGGSLLALPIFLVALNVPRDLAVPATAAVVGFAALSGAWDAWQDRQLDLRTLVRFSIPAMVLSAIGSLVSSRIPGGILRWTFAAILLYAGVRLLLPARTSGNDENRPTSPVRLTGAGAGTGLLMGLFGVGGGFLATPALVPEGGPSTAAAIPVALGAIALSAAASLVVQIPSGTFRWTLVAPALVATILGMEMGRGISRRVPQIWLRRGMGLLVLVAAVLVARH